MQKELGFVQELIKTVANFLVNYSFQVLGALIILAAGVFAANAVARFILKLCQKKGQDITLAKFMAGVARTLVLMFAVIIALGNFGITIAPFVAALGALAFGASMAIQGPLSNYGAGLSIILSRPFVVGNTITVAGVSGLVEEVKLSCTLLRDEDGVQITIPNKDIVGQILHNSFGYKIVEAVVGISYGDDPEKAIRTIQQVLAAFENVAKEPLAQVGIQQFADSSVNIGFRYWVPTVKYFQTLSAVNLAVFKAFQSAGISIPFPQREVRVIGQGLPQDSPR